MPRLRRPYRPLSPAQIKRLSRISAASDFLRDLLSRGPVEQGDVFLFSGLEGIQRSILNSAADYTRVVFVTEAGKPILWELDEEA